MSEGSGNFEIFREIWHCLEISRRIGSAKACRKIFAIDLVKNYYWRAEKWGATRLHAFAG